MGKIPAPQVQLSWMDLIEQDEQAQDDDLSTISQWHSAIPEYIVTQHTWADGDTTPAALEKLSHVLLGTPEIMARSDTGEKFKYVIVTTAVIGQKVWCACQLVGSLKDLFGQALGDDDGVE